MRDRLSAGTCGSPLYAANLSRQSRHAVPSPPDCRCQSRIESVAVTGLGPLGPHSRRSCTCNTGPRARGVGARPLGPPVPRYATRNSVTHRHGYTHRPHLSPPSPKAASLGRRSAAVPQAGSGSSPLRRGCGSVLRCSRAGGRGRGSAPSGRGCADVPSHHRHTPTRLLAPATPLPAVARARSQPGGVQSPSPRPARPRPHPVEVVRDAQLRARAPKWADRNVPRRGSPSERALFAVFWSRLSQGSPRLIDNLVCWCLLSVSRRRGTVAGHVGTDGRLGR